MNGELIKRIVKSYLAQDDALFQAAVKQIIQSEKKQNHVRIAEELQAILSNSSSQRPSVLQTPTSNGPTSRGEGSPLVEVRQSIRTLADIILDQQSYDRVSRFLEEYSKQGLLAEHGLSPKKKLLFFGPPGNGKTLCAEVVAGELGLPLYYVRFDSLVASYLGETSANIRRVFEFGTANTGVLFFDEFDAIGKTRDDRGDVGELKRVVNSFLQLLDNYQGEGPIIAATNYERILDYALWRRFDDLIVFPKATQDQLVNYLNTRLACFRLSGFDSVKAAQWCEDCSFSDAARITTEAIKSMILAGDTSILARTFQQAVEKYKAVEFQRNHANSNA